MSDVATHNLFMETIRMIKTDILTEQKNPNLIAKWCVPLNCVSVYNMPKKNYINYCTHNFKNHPKYYKIIEEVCLKKFKNGMTPREDFIELVLNGEEYISTTRNVWRICY